MINGTVRVRAMTAGDVDAVIAIADALPAAPRWARAAYETAVDPTAVPQRVALAAECEGRVAGFAIASVIPPAAELETIAVASDQQRRGIGRALMGTLYRELGARGVEEVALEVRASNPMAQALYRAMGFEEVGVRKGYYTEPVEDAVQMRQRIHHDVEN